VQSPGGLAIVGQSRELSPIPDGEIEFLRSDLCRHSFEPFHELLIGERVRIRSGVMSGVEGALVRKGDSMRFVLTLDLIKQHAAIQVDADSLEPVRALNTGEEPFSPAAISLAGASKCRCDD
jgi:hypothetical protein